MLNDDHAQAGEASNGLSFMDVIEHCLPAAVVVTDSRKNLAAINPPAERLLGLRPGATSPTSLDVLPTGLREAILRTFLTRTPQTLEITLPTAGRSQSHVHVSTSIVPSEEAGHFGVVAVLHDLSVARSFEQRLQNLGCLASIGTLSASMAHEIKNALVAVKTFIELLVQQNKDAELAGVAGREITRIDSIVSQMLTFAGPAKPTFSMLRLHDAVEHCLRLLEPQLIGKNIRLKKSLAAAPDFIWGDSYQLEQVLLNLLFNALDAMGTEGELSISTELLPPPQKGQTPQIRLQVHDTGSGISAENLPRLFDPFFTTKPKGTGLGLPITRRIIQEHNGTITVESAPNHGTTFTVLLPVGGKS